MFIPQSHGGNSTLASRLWFIKNWNSINSFDYRDTETIKNNKCEDVFFIGDSFTSGHGISDINDRFSAVVKKQLAKTLKPMNVVNLGRNGLDTYHEFQSMIKFKNKSTIEPEYIVLQYFGNDIDNVALNLGLQLKENKEGKKTSFVPKLLLNGSYLINYFYWLYVKQDPNRCFDLINHSYSNEIIFQRHIKDIQLFIDYCQDKNIPLLVVIFPVLQNIQMSEKLYVNKIIAFLGEKNIDYLNVGTLIKDIPVKKRVVNSNDGHASILVNKRVGLEIAKIIVKNRIN